MQNKCVSKQRYALFCLFIFLLFYSYTAFGSSISLHKPKFIGNSFSTIYQQHQVRGTVIDSQGVPIPSVHVLIQNSGVGTYTDNDGNFSLKASPTDVLVFSYLGFDTLSVSVNGQSEFSIELQESVTNLGEVVLNAGYYIVSDRERTGSISTIKASDIEKQPVTNPIAAMQGQMSGVLITQSTGMPGSGFDIQIRGQNSLRTDGNQPLYIVDGVPYANQSLGNDQVSTVLGAGATLSPLNSLNPNDIASIEVLKDADATAIYGSRGANGVVLITTKKGKSGKTTLEVSLQSGIGSITRYIDIMNTTQYLQMRHEAYANDGFEVYPPNAYDVNGTWDQHRDTNWQKRLIGGAAYYQNMQVSLSGGSAQTNFLVSGGYQKQTNVFPENNYYQKGSLHSQLHHKSKDDRFQMTFSLNYIADGNNQSGTDLTREAVSLPPNAPKLYDANGDLNWEEGTWNNPLRHLEGSYLANTNNLIANTVLSYKLPWGLELKTSLGYNDLQLDEKKKTPNTIYNPSFGLDSRFSNVYVNQGSQNSWIIEPQLNWKAAFGDMQIKVLLGTTFQQQKSTQMAQYAEGFSNNSLMDNLAAASYLTVLEDQSTQYKYNALFGRVNLNWKGKYIVNLTGRRDGSSRFGSGNRFANFGAVGIAWIFSKESFLKNQHLLSFGKLRFSYGTTGNDKIGDYQYLDTYATSDTNYNSITGLSPTRLFNPNFGWEVNKKLEVGIDLGFVKNRINFHLGHYRNRSSNQLVGIPLPGTTGFTSIQANLNALVENTGWEWELNTKNFTGEVFNWSTALNVTFNTNKLLEYPELEASTYANTLVVGEPLNILKLYAYNGIDAQSGIYQFEDVNQDERISNPDDRQFIANLNPKFFGGISNQLQYRGWDMSFLLQFVKQEGYGFVRSSPRPGTMNNQQVGVLDRWQQPGDQAGYQIYTTGTNSDGVRAYSRYQTSSAMITDASYIRLKNMSIGYNLPSKVLKNVSVRVFLQGQNLLTFTSYKGGDPETQSISTLPPLKIISIGANLKF